MNRIFTIVLILTMLGGCSTTTVNRTENGGLDVKHTTWFIKTEAPSLTVDRDSINEYSASFNADSRGGDVEAMAQALNMLMAISKAANPVPDP